MAAAAFVWNAALLRSAAALLMGELTVCVGQLVSMRGYAEGTKVGGGRVRGRTGMGAIVRSVSLRCLLLLLSSELEVLASLEHDLVRLRALGTLELQHDLLRGLHLLVEHGLGLTTITGLLAVITTLSYTRQEQQQSRKHQTRTPDGTTISDQSQPGPECVRRWYKRDRVEESRVKRRARKHRAWMRQGGTAATNQPGQAAVAGSQVEHAAATWRAAARVVQHAESALSTSRTMSAAAPTITDCIARACCCIRIRPALGRSIRRRFARLFDARGRFCARTLCGSGRLSGLLLPSDGVRLVGVALLAVSVLLLRVVHHL